MTANLSIALTGSGQGLNMFYIWIILLVVFLIVEVATVGLTTIWFAAGAACGLLANVLHAHIAVQIILFAAVSAVLLIFTRPVAVKYLNRRATKTNAEAYVGKEVRVTQDINNLRGEGQVIVGGMEWTARSSDDTITFRKDDIVTVVGIEGVKLIVQKKPKEGNA